MSAVSSCRINRPCSMAVKWPEPKSSTGAGINHAGCKLCHSRTQGVTLWMQTCQCMRSKTDIAQMLCRHGMYHRSHQRCSLAWQSHIWQLVKVGGNEQMVGSGLADALQQVQAVGGQPQALTAAISFRRHCIADNYPIKSLLGVSQCLDLTH